jgi:peptide/nickel transport system substrate-binding protein
MPPTLPPPARSGPSRRGLLLGGGASALLTLAACATGSSNSTASSSPAALASGGTPKPGGTLKIAFWNDLQGAFDPNQVYWIETRSLNRNFADSLTDQDPKTGEIVPWLAESWTISPDTSEFTFKLRTDVTFSDGTPFNAAAVKTAYDGIVALGANSTLGVVYLAGYKSSTVIDEHTVKVSFKGPNAQFLQASSTTTLAILSPDTYKKTPAQRAAGQVIGSGPFTLDHFTAGQSVKLVRRKDYAWPSKLITNRGAAYLDAIEASYISEDNVRVGDLLAGTIHIAWPRLPISQADQTRITDAGHSIVQRSLPGIADLILPNVKGGRPLSDLKVRQAFNMAIDRRTYASTIFWDGYPVVSSPLEASTPGYTNVSNLLAYDPAGAASLLDAAGWARRPDGFRYKDGKKLTLVYLVGSNPSGAQLLQDQLKKAGFDVQLKVATAAQILTLEKAGDYDLAESYLTRGDASVLGSILDTSVVKAPAGRNTQDAATATQVSRYFADGLANIDADRRNAAYAALQKYVVTQGVAVPLYERLQVSGISSKVHGFAWTSEGFLRANDLWIST